MAESSYDLLIGISAETERMQRDLQKALRSVNTFEKGTNRATKSVETSFRRVDKVVDPITASLKRHESAIEALQTDYKRFGLTADEAARSIQFHNQQITGLNKRLDTGSRFVNNYALASTRGLNSTRAMGTAVQQAGFQVGDFAVQIASGQSAMRAFIQQGAQLVSMFGPAGAVAGAVLAIGGALTMSLWDSEEATDAAADAAESYKDILKELSSESQNLAERQAELTGGLFEFRTTSLRRDLEDAREELETLRALETPSTAAEEMFGGTADDRTVGARERIAELNEKIAKIQVELNENREKAIENIRLETERLGEFNSRLASGEIALKDAEVAKEAFNLAIEKGIPLWGAEFDALMRVIKANNEAKNAASEMQEQREEHQEFLEDMQDAIEDATDKEREAAEKRAEAIAKLQNQMDPILEATREYADALKLVVDADLSPSERVDLLKFLKERLETTVQDTKENKEKAKALAKQADAVQSLLDKVNPLREAERAFAEDMTLLNAALAQGQISQMEYAEATQFLRNRLEQAKWQANDLRPVFEAAGSAFDSFADSIRRGSFDAGQALEQLAFDIAKVIEQQMFLQATGGATSSLGGALGMFAGDLFGNLFGSPADSFRALPGTGTSAIRMLPNPHAGFADGGMVHGPGTGRSDSIPARLSNGEFVVNARSTRMFAPLLHAINEGKAQRFADGGMVGRNAAGSGGSVEVNIYNETGGEVETRQDGDSIDVIISKAVSNDIRNAGPVYQSIKRRFNVTQNLRGRS